MKFPDVEIRVQVLAQEQSQTEIMNEIMKEHQIGFSICIVPVCVGGYTGLVYLSVLEVIQG